MDFNELLTNEHFAEISKLAKCEVSEIQVFAIPDSLAISYFLTSKSEARQHYKDYAEKAGKLVENPFSWDELKGYNNRLILFPGGFSVCATPFKKPVKSEFEAISDVIKDSKNFEIVKLEV